MNLEKTIFLEKNKLVAHYKKQLGKLEPYVDFDNEATKEKYKVGLLLYA